MRESLGVFAYVCKAHPHVVDDYHANMPKNKKLKEIVGENVQAVMKAKGLSQPKVADAAKRRGLPIDQTTVGRIARVEFPATLDSVEAMAAGLGVEPWQLLMPDFRIEQKPLNDSELKEVDAARKVLAGLSAAQRDLFLQDGLVRDLLTRPHFPVEKMGPGWTAPKTPPQSGRFLGRRNSGRGDKGGEK